MNLKKNYKLAFFYLLLLCILLNKINEIEYHRVKVCICTLGKSENKYINEFVEHYKNYGIDKIYLADNNDINGEHFEDKIKKYIDNGFVELSNWRGVRGNGEFLYYKIMDNCYQKHQKNFDWLIFYELDEFLYLKNFIMKISL